MPTWEEVLTMKGPQQIEAFKQMLKEKGMTMEQFRRTEEYQATARKAFMERISTPTPVTVQKPGEQPEE